MLHQGRGAEHRERVARRSAQERRRNVQLFVRDPEGDEGEDGSGDG